MSTFDEAALSKLTAKIDGKLGESQPKILGNGKSRESGNKKRKQTSERDTELSEPPSNKRSRSEARNSKDKINTTKSKKTGTSAKTTNSAPQHVNVLLNEIKALGGSEEDLRLVENIDSDEEGIFENENNLAEKEKGADEKLRDELAHFAAGLGFDKVASDFAAAESESEEQDGEGQDEDDNDGAGNKVDQGDQSNRAAAVSVPERPRGIFKGKTVSKPLVPPNW